MWEVSLGHFHSRFYVCHTALHFSLMLRTFSMNDIFCFFFAVVIMGKF